jgi:hypothetical protein
MIRRLRANPKNRRFERMRVLDVKLRTKEIRAARLRLAGTAASIALGTVVSLYVLWRVGDWVLDRFVFRNDAFAIRTLDIATDGSIPVPLLRRWAGVQTGENLLALDLVRVKRDLELAPWIGSAAVERVLPNTLRIRVTEREPIARLKIPELQAGGGVTVASYYLDVSGCVIRPLDSLVPDAGSGRGGGGPAAPDDLPVLSGVNAAEFRPGSVIRAPKVAAALRMIAGFDHSPMAGYAELSEVDTTRTEVLVLTTADGSQITISTDRLDQQMRRWRLVHDFGLRYGRAIRALDLSVTNNCPVLWTESGAVPSVNPRQPSLNRKKHV